MVEASDALLLDHARTGDRRALEELIGRHQRRVYRFGLKMCRDPEDAKDVLQETLLAAARTVKDFRGASSGARLGSATCRASSPGSRASSDSSCSGANLDRRRFLMQKLRAIV